MVVKPHKLASQLKSHIHPVWRDQANFLIHAEIALENQFWGYEQLWTKQIEPLKFMICCIPFFVYGIALGDIVNTEHNDDYFLKDLSIRSGNLTVRFSIRVKSIYDDLLRALKHECIEHECASDTMIASSFKTKKNRQNFIDQYCQSKNDVLYEFGN